VAIIGKIDANLREMKAEIRTGREEVMTRLDALIQNNMKRWKPG
jgi:hypothetical protein